MFITISMALLLLGSGATKALADCAAELEKVETELANWVGNRSTREAMERLLADAKEAYAQNKENRCLKKIKRIREKM